MKLKGVKSYRDKADPKTKNLKEYPCAAVKLSVSTNIDNGGDDKLIGASENFYENENYEVYWGFFGAAIHQIFPGQTTDYIYVENLSDLSIRCNKAIESGMDLNISVFVEVQ
ncbi:MAG TPA: hypothetical protein VF692_01150 [Pyrinomonadaceae bacterium]|jgi:hypothetical protein